MDPIPTAPKNLAYRQLRYKLAALVVVVLSIVLLALAWSFSSLRDWLDVDRIVLALRQLASGHGLLVAALAFAVALVFAVPLTFLTLVVVVAFGPWAGFVCAMTGITLVSLVWMYWTEIVPRRRSESSFTPTPSSR